MIPNFSKNAHLYTDNFWTCPFSLFTGCELSTQNLRRGGGPCSTLDGERCGMIESSCRRSRKSISNRLKPFKIDPFSTLDSILILKIESLSFACVFVHDYYYYVIICFVGVPLMSFDMASPFEGEKCNVKNLLCGIAPAVRQIKTWEISITKS